jgi:hypothetical protein
VVLALLEPANLPLGTYKPLLGAGSKGLLTRLEAAAFTHLDLPLPGTSTAEEVRDARVRLYACALYSSRGFKREGAKHSAIFALST